MIERENACDGCRFFWPDDPNKRFFGECHRYPPGPGYLRPSDGGMEWFTASWPQVVSTDFCGEWQKDDRQ